MSHIALAVSWQALFVAPTCDVWLDGDGPNHERPGCLAMRLPPACTGSSSPWVIAARVEHVPGSPSLINIPQAILPEEARPTLRVQCGPFDPRKTWTSDGLERCPERVREFSPVRIATPALFLRPDSEQGVEGPEGQPKRADIGVPSVADARDVACRPVHVDAVL